MADPHRARTSDGVDLWWQITGVGPAIIMVPGRGDASDLYPPEFTDPLIKAGFSVVRCDPRDTGLSGDGGNAYRLSEMADDVLTVCDAATVDKAHVVGLSMGGLIAVDLASRHPQRVSSLTLIAAMSPDPAAGIGEAFFDGIDAEAVAGTLAAMGSPTIADEAWVRRDVERARTRAPARPQAGQRHQAAAMRLGWPELAALDAITAAALVIHGVADRVLRVAHAHALAQGIASSDLHLVDTMGHLPHTWRMAPRRPARRSPRSPRIDHSATVIRRGCGVRSVGAGRRYSRSSAGRRPQGGRR